MFEVRRVTPGYFEAMGIPVVEGRTFTPDDHNQRLPTVIVSNSLKRRYWPDASALGKRITVAGTTAQVVGVGGDVHDTSLGLAYLLVGPNGSRYWRYNYRFQRKSRTLALGVYPDVSLEKARARHQEARCFLADGVDPSTRRAEFISTARLRLRSSESWQPERHWNRRQEDDLAKTIMA